MTWQSAENSRLLRMFGITLEDYEWLLVVNDGGCHFCGTKQNRRLVIDHDHLNKRIRGLLCFRCNGALNFIFDHPKLLENAVRYTNSRR